MAREWASFEIVDGEGLGWRLGGVTLVHGRADLDIHCDRCNRIDIFLSSIPAIAPVQSCGPCPKTRSVGRGRSLRLYLRWWSFWSGVHWQSALWGLAAYACHWSLALLVPFPTQPCVDHLLTFSGPRTTREAAPSKAECDRG